VQLPHVLGAAVGVVVGAEVGAVVGGGAVGGSTTVMLSIFASSPYRPRAFGLDLEAT